MKTLILLRHAKSDWSRAGLADHDRPLNTRGRKAAPLMAAYLEEQGLKPDIVRCSTAKRTKETLEAFLPRLNPTAEITYLEPLYHASATEILRDIVSLPDDQSIALYVGHNPGMHDLALRLIGSVDRDNDLAPLERKFPTAALAVFTFGENEWHDVNFGTGRLKLVASPKNLMHAE